jgi:hypothetical protein
MRAHAMQTSDVGAGQRGWALAHALRAKTGGWLLRKGAILDDDALARWSDVAPGEVHLLEPAPDDVHEDAAGARVAAAVSGDGIRVKGPAQSRYNLIAERKGLLRVNVELLRQINRVEGVTVFSLLDRQPVLPGKIIAGVKVTPILIPEARIAEVERLAREAPQPPLVVRAFTPRRVAVLATEGLSDKLRERFHAVVERKLGWYGSSVIDLRFIPAEPKAVAETLRDFLDEGAEVLMAAGGNTIDPLDPISVALSQVGAEMVHHGAPSHPGSMFWLARVGDVPIVNLATCSMYSRATVADLILPLLLTGERVTSDDIADLGHGGLLERDMAFRFPDYDAESSDEADSEDE